MTTVDPQSLTNEDDRSVWCVNKSLGVELGVFPAYEVRVSLH